jgi:hypothetical protein
MDKTLFTSAIYLREHYDLPVLVVEGDMNYDHRMVNPQAVRGALSSMLLQYAINVLSTRDAEETVSLIAMMARQEQQGIPEISLIPKRKATSLPDLQRRVIEMLPGCGLVMARDLLQRFGSVTRVLSASEEELLSVRGIGPKKAQAIRRVLSAEYEAVDTERQIEDAIETDASILFDRRPVKQVARQHYIFGSENDRHIVDLVYHDPEADEIILVELKRGRLDSLHYHQICRYLDHARQSPLLCEYLDAGAELRGVLATVEPSSLKSKRRDVDVVIVDQKRVIDVLKARRDAVL